LPVIMYSGFITNELRTEAKIVGIQSLLCKPYGMNDFLKTVHDFIILKTPED
jgi:hypothetical protein